MTQREETDKKSINGRYAVPIILFIAIAGMGFCDIRIFTDSESNSKWYWLGWIVSLGGLSSLFLRQMIPSYRFGDPARWLLPLFFYGMVRATTGTSAMFFLASCTLFALLFFLSRSIIRQLSFAALAGSVTTTAALLALYGIGQWIGWLPRGEQFDVTGNFDNPAGYASMLALSLPFVLYFTVSSYSFYRHAVWTIWALVTTAIVLSASRTGVVTVAAITFAFIVKRYKGQVWHIAGWKKIVATGLALALAAGLYFAKRNSADGRLLIWKCTVDMICDKPLFGHGYKSFEATYMLYQARFFEQHPESRFAPLADNVKHPFNEFLKLTAEFGIIGLLLSILFAVQIARAYRRNPSEESFVLVTALIAIGIFSCFSYPFSYPFTWFITAVGTEGLYKRNDKKHRTDNRRTDRFAKPAAAMLSLALAVYTGYNMYYNTRWHAAVYKNKPSDGGLAFIEYEQLYPFLKKDPYFVYNYAARANYAGDFIRSTTLAAECETMLNDYDIQMLLADNFKRQGDFIRAEEHYRQASNMCPGRFMPLYELVNLYDATGRKEDADTLARAIVLKPEKIPSGTISAIKMKMERRFSGE